jgi:hypothetical protein
VRGEGHEPDTRCGTLGTSGHATTKSSIHSWGVLYKSGVYAPKVWQLTAGDLRGVLDRTEGGGILPDRPAEVSRGHSRLGAGDAREAPQGRKAGQQIGGAATRVGRRPERWTGVVARRGAGRWHPARCRIISGAWDELTAGTPGPKAPVGVMAHPDSICRTAGYVTRMSGGVGGGRP